MWRVGDDAGATSAVPRQSGQESEAHELTRQRSHLGTICPYRVTVQLSEVINTSFEMLSGIRLQGG